MRHFRDYIYYSKVESCMELGKYEFGGQERCSANYARLISELEGSYQMLKYLGFEEDMLKIESIKKNYYKLYFRQLKAEKYVKGQ